MLFGDNKRAEVSTAPVLVLVSPAEVRAWSLPHSRWGETQDGRPRTAPLRDTPWAWQQDGRLQQKPFLEQKSLFFYRKSSQRASGSRACAASLRYVGGEGFFFLVYRQIFLRLSTRWPTAAAPLRRARGRGTTEGTGALYIEKTGKTSLKLKKTVDCPFKSERPIPLAARGSPIWPPTPTPRWRPYFFPARAPPLEELSPSLRRYWLRGRGPAPFWSQAPPLSGCFVSSRRKPRPPL